MWSSVNSETTFENKNAIEICRPACNDTTFERFHSVEHMQDYNEISLHELWKQ